MFSGQHAERQGSKVARSLLSIVIMVLVVFGLSRLLNTFVFGAYEIPSGSMEDTIEVGDLVFSEKLSYYTSEPQNPYTVPEGCLWVMGDNRTNSQDSRYFGAIDASSVTGHAVFTYWPIPHIGVLS